MESRPYLVLPKLVEQPTWGGSYIVEYKNWSQKESLLKQAIGQSYELFGSSKLALDITDSTSIDFGPDALAPESTTVSIQNLPRDDASDFLGPKIFDRYKKMPLLIKFTQAKGNSFQLHKKPTVQDPYWQPKAESWYFFEEGYMTFGIKPGINVEEYKRTCLEINDAMKLLSNQVVQQKLSLADANEQAKTMIANKNPWQFVNTYHVPKFTMVDLSMGGLHHSWEADANSPFGNIVYEVQQDVPDETSTLRSFDQGKIKEDGTIRELTIEQYFEFLDTDPGHNDVETAKQLPSGNRILTTANYYLDLLSVSEDVTETTGSSFAHLFVREGDVNIQSGSATIRVTKGHSCIIPHNANTFTVHSNVEHSVVLKTGIDLP